MSCDPTPAPPSTNAGMLVGASMNVSGNHDPRTLEADMGLTVGQHLDLFRCYDTNGPAASWSRIQNNEFVGKRPMWWSCKGDLQTWIRGGYDANAIALAKSYDPSWPAMQWTLWHEPQPKVVSGLFSRDAWVKAFTHFYQTVKPHCPPNLKLGPIHGGFSFTPGNPTTADPGAWMTPHDFMGLDCYGGPTGTDIVDQKRFHRFVETMCDGDYGQCYLAETGARAAALGSSEVASWLRRNGNSLGEIGVSGICLWNSTHTEFPGPLDKTGMDAWGDVWRAWSPERPR